MKQLSAYLESIGWKVTSPGILQIEKSGYVFRWKIGTNSAELWRWPKKLTTEYDKEMFILQNEDDCRGLAEKITYGEYPASIPPDPKTGLRILHR